MRATRDRFLSSTVVAGSAGFQPAASQDRREGRQDAGAPSKSLRPHWRVLFLTAALAVAAALDFEPLGAADWPQFRGPHRDGVAREGGLLKAWPAGGPRRLWKVPVGDGFSGMVVAGGRLFTLYGKGGDELAVAHDAATGRQLWRVRIDALYQSSQGNGPRSTPTVDGGVVYALSASGNLFALDAATGKTVWNRDLKRDFGARPPEWGVSTSPLVEGNLLLLDVGGSSGKSAAALDKKTGKTVWTSQSDQAGYSAPIAITVGGVRQVLFFTGTALTALKPADGKLLWRVPWRTDWDVNAATPIFVAPDKVYVSSGYDTGAALLRIKPGDGGARADEVWRSKRMKNQFSSSVLVGHHIYGFDNSVLKSIAVATGQDVWKQSGLGHGSLIAADGHLIVLSERGRLALVEATPAAYREKASADVLSGKCWTAPTLANGRLYVRNEEEMLAFDVAAPKAAPAKPKPAAR
jgi:outer membrane protein assembly factor BamB